ncbi:hypothetical protein AN946_01485 [Trueperella pyogenes]|nr:hypothetical protein AN946_01485 [Trueperella pyogenes]
MARQARLSLRTPRYRRRADCSGCHPSFHRPADGSPPTAHRARRLRRVRARRPGTPHRRPQPADQPRRRRARRSRPRRQTLHHPPPWQREPQLGASHPNRSRPWPWF